MEERTRYAYEQEIKRLRRELSALEYYKSVCRDIFEQMVSNRMNNNDTNQGWILKQFGRLWK